MHIEKAILGVALLLLLGGVTYFLLLGAPYQAAGPDGTAVGPTELAPKMQTLAERVAKNYRSAPTVNLDKKGPANTEIGKLFDWSAFGDIATTLPALQPPPPILVES